MVVIRERGSSTLPQVFKSESAAIGWVSRPVSPATRLMTDEAGPWNELHSRFDMERIDHSRMFSTQTGVYTNGAEGFFSRLRVAARLATTIISLAPIWSVMRRRVHGVRNIAGSIMVYKLRLSWGWRWLASRQSIGAGIGTLPLDPATLP